jgi:hypothetical protein
MARLSSSDMLQTGLLQVQRGKYVIEAEISPLRGSSTELNPFVADGHANVRRHPQLGEL